MPRRADPVAPASRAVIPRRSTRCEDLARVVDGNAGPQAERRLRHGKGAADGRVEEDREGPEERDRRDRIGDVPRPGTDDRRGGDDRGVAADGRADRDEERQPALDVDDPRDQQHDRERGGHRDDDDDGRGQADPRDLAEAEPGTEQDDPEPEHPLRREGEARCEGREPRSANRADDDPGHVSRDERHRDGGGQTGCDRAHVALDRGRAGQRHQGKPCRHVICVACRAPRSADARLDIAGWCHRLTRQRGSRYTGASRRAMEPTTAIGTAARVAGCGPTGRDHGENR